MLLVALEEPLLRDEGRLWLQCCRVMLELWLRRVWWWEMDWHGTSRTLLELRLEELLLAGRLGSETVGGLQSPECPMGARRRRSMD